MFAGRALDKYSSLLNRRVFELFFLGVSSGLPLLLVFSTLSLWLLQSGMSRETVTFFSWAGLGYSFKFVWAPLVDQLSIPFLGRYLGQRRSWLLISQISLISAIVAISQFDPSGQDISLTWMAATAVWLGFSSATQDIIIDAFRIEAVKNRLQAIMSAAYIAGYRVGMLIAGAGSLYLVTFISADPDIYDSSAWQITYRIMALAMLIGVLTCLLAREPENEHRQKPQQGIGDSLRLFSSFLVLATSFVLVFFFTADIVASAKSQINLLFHNNNLSGFIIEFFRLSAALTAVAISAWVLIRLQFVKRAVITESYKAPVMEFMGRFGARITILILVIIATYRISDIINAAISNIFYVEMGYSKIEIANIAKAYGLVLTIIGGFLGGYFTYYYGLFKTLFAGAVLAALSNLLFLLLLHSGHDLTMLTVVIGADNLAAGLASAAFVAFLSALINVSYTASQYAIFSSLFSVIPKLFSGYAGMIITNSGYDWFFIMTALIGLPNLLILYVLRGYITSLESK